jgi:nicotinate-nucleotide pyrophosphorylase (carboxylating)
MFAHLLPPHYKDEVIQWIKDDCPSFDVGGFVVGEKEESAHLYCKQSCVLPLTHSFCSLHSSTTVYLSFF